MPDLDHPARLSLPTRRGSVFRSLPAGAAGVDLRCPADADSAGQLAGDGLSWHAARSAAFHEKPGSYLAFLGRISPEKGLDNAIEIAGRARLPLRVAAKIYPGERPYFERVIEPLFRASPWVQYVGEVGGASKNAFLGGAAALLFPIEWEEPFGLVMIEAMACGTPVVAFRRGSVPEVMTEGVTGYVVDDIAAAAEAVAQRSLSTAGPAGQTFPSASTWPAWRAIIFRSITGSLSAKPVRPWRFGITASSSARADAIHGHRRLLGASASLPRGPDMAERAHSHLPPRPPEGDLHHVLAPSSITDDRTRVLKHGDTFAVFDHLGQIKPGGLGEEGVFHDGTRYLSRLVLESGRPAALLPWFHGSRRERSAFRSPHEPGSDPRSSRRCAARDLALGRAYASLARLLLLETQGQEPSAPSPFPRAFACVFAPISPTFSKSAA